MEVKKTSLSLLRANRDLIVFLVLMMIFRSAFADWVKVPTGSMNPTIVEGDRILVNKMAFGVRVPFTTIHLTAGDAPARGDIVVFDSPTSGITLIKRVIGLPGDVIAMHDDQLIINGRPVSYAFAPNGAGSDLPESMRRTDHVIATENLPGKAHAIMLLPDRPALRNFGPIVVGPGRYFMMGDSRDNSEDSRYIGTIPRAVIVGRALRIVLSLDPERDYLPRSSRILKPLN